MILDAKNLFADGLAYNGTSSVIDLENAGAGKGEPIKCFIAGSSLAGVTAVVIHDGTTSSPSTVRDTIIVSAATLNAGPYTFYLPEGTQRYVKIGALTGGSAGTYTAGIVQGSQSAR